MKQIKENQKAITLIALVITVIILLILAGISIASLTGNGLFEKAKLAKEKQENAQIEEDTKLGDYENKIGQYIDGNRDTVTISKEEYEALKEKIEKIQTYSTEEVIVGTWIDGKSIYKRTTSIDKPDNQNVTMDVSDWGISTVVNIEGIIEYSNGNKCPIYYNSGTDSYFIYYGSGNIYFKSLGIDAKCYATVYYTKDE